MRVNLLFSRILFVAPIGWLAGRLLVVAAGVVAAITAAQNGAKVYLLEKEAKISGNSAKATSGINFVGQFCSHLLRFPLRSSRLLMRLVDGFLDVLSVL